MRTLSEQVRGGATVLNTYLYKSDDNANEFGGTGRLIETVFVILSFILTWIDTENLGDPGNNGTYDGFVGSIQSRETDFFLPLIPIQLTSHNEPVDYGPPANHSIKVRIASSLQTSFNDADLMKSMFCLSMNTTLLLLLSVLVFALFMSKFEKKLRRKRTFLRSFCMSSFYLFCLVIAQPFLSTKRLPCRCMLLFHAIAYMLFLQYWENMMTTDLLSPDTSRFIDSIDDILADTSIGIIMNSGLPSYNAMSREKPASKLGQIFSRVNANKSSFESWKSPKLMYQMLGQYNRRDRVIITNEDTLSYSMWSSCYLLNTSDNRISRQSYYEVITAPIYNKRISKAAKTYLDQRSYQIHESGVYLHLWQTHITNPSNYYQGKFALKLTKPCIVSDLDVFIGQQRDENGSNALSNHCILGVWNLLAAGLITSFITVTVERRRPPIRKFQRVLLSIHRALLVKPIR